MKKVLFFIPTLTGGGAEKVLVNLVNNMNHERFEITVMTLFDYGVNKQYLTDKVKYKYIFKRLFRGNVTFLKLFSPQHLYKKMIKEKYDVVISYLQSPTMRIVSGCNDGTKLISWIHNEFYDIAPISHLYRNMKEMKESFSRYNKFVFVANTAEEAMKSILPEYSDKYCTINNTIETDKIKEKAKEKLEVDFPANKINLVSTGRFTKQKAFERLIRIVGRLKQDGYNVFLSILGDGALREEYEKLINELGLKEDIRLLGYRDNPYKYVKNADLFVCSSLHEGFSTAVTESLIVGTPVITTMCSGMEEMLGKNGEYGMITKNSEDSLYEGLCKLLNNEREMERLKRQAEIRGKFFETSRTVEEVEKLIESV